MGRSAARKSNSRASAPRSAPRRPQLARGVPTGQTGTVNVGGYPVTGPIYMDSVGTPYVEGQLGSGQIVRVALNQSEESPA